MTGKKRPKLKELTVAVAEHNGAKVFMFGWLRFDKLYTYDMLALYRDAVRLRIYRAGKLFDYGSLVEFGTHGASHMFMGLGKACPSAPSEYDFRLLGHYLLPQWFEIGDEIKFLGNRASFRENILDHWYKVLREGRLKKSWDAMDVREERLMKKAIKKAGGWNALEAKEKEKKGTMSRLSNRVWKQAYGPLERRLKKVPVPEVVAIGS